MKQRKQIRNIETEESGIPIIALTAHGLADERDRLIASGINDYVGKPISQPQLLQVLQKWLGRTTTASELTALSEANLHSFDVQDTDAQQIGTPSSDLQDTGEQPSGRPLPWAKPIQREKKKRVAVKIS